MNRIYAEDMNYWQTSTSSPSSWLDKAAKEVERAGGTVLMQGIGTDSSTGREAYALYFHFNDDQFKVVWSALPLKSETAKKHLGAKRQAATLLYYEVKARCMTARVKGFRQAFFAYWMLPDGRTASEATAEEIMQLETSFLKAIQLEDGYEVEG